jgi:hypothetical protein
MTGKMIVENSREKKENSNGMAENGKECRRSSCIECNTVEFVVSVQVSRKGKQSK